MPEVVYYVDGRGHCLVEEFLDGLNEETELPYAMRQIERLEEHGHNLRRPHADFLRDDIYELRIRPQRNQYRILYFFYFQEKIVLTHGFHKPENRVDPIEIDRAIEMRERYFAVQERRR